LNSEKIQPFLIPQLVFCVKILGSIVAALFGNWGENATKMLNFAKFQKA
jgi:hypothetical protein